MCVCVQVWQALSDALNDFLLPSRGGGGAGAGAGVAVGGGGGGHALGGGELVEVTKNVCVRRADGCVRICGRTADEERFVNFCSSPRFVNSEGSDNDKGKCVFIKLGLQGVCKGFSVTATATLEMFAWPFFLCAGGSSAGVLHTCPFVLSKASKLTTCCEQARQPQEYRGGALQN